MGLANQHAEDPGRPSTRMTPLQMIQRWRQGCIDTRLTGRAAEYCPECTRHLIDLMEEALIEQARRGS